ncbi:MAG: ATP-binding cassette domain-containing protein [Clostridiales bacterium]|jgi:ABC-type lipoprotein export system ATPase subunit|nr:ATP-binding cassette domain-containing protein [Clostridiales bacterium]
MLQAINISKTYHASKGERCAAVKNITLALPDTGLVFITGKSGSGKSTLLNLLSGMDMPDGGDVVVEGRSTKDFSPSEFDGYRNTYAGYIFQDFGIIDEFNVRENIAISRQLQGRAATAEAVADALAPVGLTGYGERRVQELSGGQRQRVAIARALLKNPKIIFADEPTGSLDADTGKQIFELFRELSLTRLVVVVSHDTDSALIYGDRLITLADGEIVSDKVKTAKLNLAALKAEYQQKVDASFSEAGGARSIAENGCADDSVTCLQGLHGVRRQKKCPQAPGNTFYYADQAKLPLRQAAKIGVSGLARKKVRFVFTVLLSVIALALFCVADTMRSYSIENASLNTFGKLGINTLLVAKTQSVLQENGETRDIAAEFSAGDIAGLSQSVSAPFKSLPVDIRLPTQTEIPESEAVFENRIRLLVESPRAIAEETLKGFYNATLVAGRYPGAADDAVEILISDYLADCVMTYGGVFGEKTVYPNVGYDELSGAGLEQQGVAFKIVGVFSTDYKTGLADGKQSARGRFSLESVYGACLAEGGAVQNYLVKQPIFPSAAFIGENDDNAVNWQFTVIGAATVAALTESATLMRIKYADGYNAEHTLADNEIVIGFSVLNEMLRHGSDAQGEPVFTFEGMTASDFQRLRLRFTQGAYERTPALENARIIAVVDDGLTPQLESVLVVTERVKALCVADSLATFALFAPLPAKRAEQRKLLRYLTDNHFGYSTYATPDLKVMDTLFSMLEKILGGASVVLFLFVAALIFNFISSGISDKSREIGILRSLGARGKDTALIFLVQGAIIAAVDIVLASILSVAGVLVVNASLTSNFTTVLSVLSLNPLSFLYTALSCIFIILVSSLIPLAKLIRLRPIDVIKSVN